MECSADTDPQLGYSSTFGLFVIVIGGAGASFAVLILEGLFSLKRGKRREMTSVGVLVGMTERERLLGEVASLKRKLEEQKSIITKLRRRQEEEEEGGRAASASSSSHESLRVEPMSP